MPLNGRPAASSTYVSMDPNEGESAGSGSRGQLTHEYENLKLNGDHASVA